jgi:AraC-like DNA-binding protein
MFPSRFYFDQPTLEMIFHNRYLDTPVKQTAKDVPDFLAIAPNLMTTHRVDNSLTGRIRRMLQNVDNVDALPLKVIAESFGRTPETIRRKLKDEGSSYAEIKESVRHDMAVYLLKKTDTPINQVALNVGFSDSSTFNRAFKKWTGLTPGDYRRDHS